MNVVFISPHFPPQFFLFCTALKARGITVLAVGDAPPGELRHELREALSAYYYVPDMNRYDEMLRAVAYLIHRHGRIDRIDSLNEHWLELEARLRVDFNIFGQRPQDTAINRSKSRMREVFRKAGIPCSEGEKLQSRDHAWALVQQFGYPVVFKPDVGVGAARTFKVSNQAELEAALEQPLEGFIVEKFEKGPLTSFDGLCTRDGKIVFATSHRFSHGIMEIVNHRLGMYYYSRREIPPLLEELGRKAVAAFDIRERFFHIEFFELEGGGYRALEVNVRPPGGFTTDLMNYGSDIDIYELWARVLAGESLENFSYARNYFAAHIGRRSGAAYKLSHEELVRELGPRLILERSMPEALAGAMGEHMYLLRDPDEASLLHVIDRALELR